MSALVVQLRALLRHPRVLGGVSLVVMILGALILLLARVPASDPAALATSTVSSAPSHKMPAHDMHDATPALASTPSP